MYRNELNVENDFRPKVSQVTNVESDIDDLGYIQQTIQNSTNNLVI